MLNRTSLTPTAVALGLALAACSDRSSLAAPYAPPPRGTTIGMITGTVEGNKFTATFTPMGAQSAVSSAISPAIYGDPSKALITGQFVNLVSVIGSHRTWTFNVSMHNLLSYAVGSNYGTNPLDSAGVFLGFTLLPTVTLPNPCHSCAVSVLGTMGTANFTGAGQPYYWYNKRPQAAGTAMGKDSTAALTWTFQTNTWNPGVTDTVHAFTFQLYVNAFWPRPNDTQWSVAYDATSDSLPDTQAEPRWTKFASNGSPTLGTESWSSAGLQMYAASNAFSIYHGRRDSLGTNSGFMDATLRVANADAGTVQAAFGFAEATGGREMFAAIASDRVGLGNFNEANGNWSFQAGAYMLNGAQFHTYRLRKIGTGSTGTVVICVDGTQRVSRTYNQQQTVRATFQSSSTVFGLDGRGAQDSAFWKGVSWTIGSNGGGC